MSDLITDNPIYIDTKKKLDEVGCGMCLAKWTQVTLQLRNFPNDSQASSSLGPFTISSSTQKVDTRARARAIALKVENTSSAQSWKLGTFRLDIQPDGRR